MRRIPLLPTLALVLVMVACQPPDQTARDTNAALSGAIHAAQTQYLATCQANPAQAACQTINRAVDGQNALVSALETYCGWPAGTVIDNASGCIPHKDAGTLLQAAVSRASQLTSEVKGLVHP